MSQGMSQGDNQSFSKRRRTGESTFGSKRFKSGKGKGSFGKRGVKSLQQQVATLQKIVKSDHKTLTKSLEYADFYMTTTYINPTYNTVWNMVKFMDPLNWIASRRASGHTATSAEATLHNLTIHIGARHSPLDTSGVTINYNIIICSGKGDWLPSASTGLRDNIDYTRCGAGLPYVYNQNNLKILKKLNLRTKQRTTGDMINSSTHMRTVSLNMKKLLKGNPVTTTAADNNWKRMVATDFEPDDQIFFFVNVDTCEGITWLNAPAVSITPTYTVSML